MVKKSVFALGWRPLGSRERCWQVRECVDVAEAARLGRLWRVSMEAGGGACTTW